MSRRTAALFFVLTAAGASCAADDFFDRVEESLSWHTAEGAVRARVSGAIDVEVFRIPQPAPALLYSEDGTLATSRLSAFLDVQAGSSIYAFAQLRVDRGFDPGDEKAALRLDEYALRWTPSREGRFSLQAGKFATLVGNWVARHASWDNPFVTAPLPYENLTGIWDAAPAASVETLLAWAHVRPLAPAGVAAADKELRLPIIWGPSYTHGAAVSGRIGEFTYAAEIKNAAISSRPTTWDSARFKAGHASWSARLGYQPNQMWNFGLSVAEGSYLAPSAAGLLAPRLGVQDYRQRVVAQDLGFAWHHWQVWAEAFTARFEIPRVGEADTFAYYVEARYKFTPQLFGAVRWNEQVFDRLPDRAGSRERWGVNLRRLDLAPTYRLSPHAQLKLQYSLEFHALGPSRFVQWAGAQVTVRF